MKVTRAARATTNADVLSAMLGPADQTRAATAPSSRGVAARTRGGATARRGGGVAERRLGGAAALPHGGATARRRSDMEGTDARSVGNKTCSAHVGASAAIRRSHTPHESRHSPQAFSPEGHFMCVPLCSPDRGRGSGADVRSNGEMRHGTSRLEYNSSSGQCLLLILFETNC